jgi:Uma2 family endonuclease
MNMSMVRPPKGRMKVAEFLAWAEAQPQGRFELVEGEVVAMSPERVLHNVVKLEVAIALRDAVRAAGLPCIVFTDGVGVVTDSDTVRIPDASVQCGDEANLDAMTIDAPLIVVEVVSPTSERNDRGVKLIDYFSVASIQHYLIVYPEKRAIIHHQRKEGGIQTHIAHDGDIALNPPGIRVAVAALLGPMAPGGTEVPS